MRQDEAPSERARWQSVFFLRRGDQAVAAMLTCFAFLAMGGYFWQQGGLSGRLVEIEQIPRRTAEFRVDVNAADWTELAQIPEIGETLARRIIDYRQAHGPYERAERLLDVPGIGPRTLDKMRPFLEFGAREPLKEPAEGAPRPPS